MSRTEKLFNRLMLGQSDASFSFDELCQLLAKLGYGESFLNLQRGPSGKAKSYQVRQVRSEVKRLNLRP